MRYYIGIDSGKYNTKAVVVDSNNEIVYKVCIQTRRIISDIKYIFKMIKDNISGNYQIYNIGVTGENRFIVGKFLATNIVINEIECIYEYANERELEGNILELSSDNSKILNIKNNKQLDYKIYKSSNSINSNFIYKVAQLLKIDINKIILVKEDINFKNDNLVLLYEEIQELNNNNVDKNKILSSLVKKMFKELPPCKHLLGYFSQNKSILEYLEVNYNDESYYYLALGIAIIAKKIKSTKIYNLDIQNDTLERKISKCNKCLKNCEIVSIYRNHELLDYFGNNCEKGKLEEFKHLSFS